MSRRWAGPSRMFRRQSWRQGAVSSYVESQGDYCTGFDYVRPYAENEYLVCAKIGEYEWEAEYIVEVNGSDAWVIGRLDGGVFRPV